MALLVNPNPTPEVGQLLYTQYTAEAGDPNYSDIIYVDEPIQPGKQWFYTQIAHLEEVGGVETAYLDIEAGGKPAGYTRLATDADIRQVLLTVKAGRVTGHTTTLSDWLTELSSCPGLLPTELERIRQITAELA